MPAKRAIKSNKISNSRLLDRKTPRDDFNHHLFSITKHAILDNNYRVLNAGKTLTESMREREEYLPKFQPEPEKEFDFNLVNPVKIKKARHQRSPYVVKVGKPAEKALKSEANDVGWLKEVERLRRDTADKYKSKASDAKVNLLPRRKKFVWAPSRFLRFILTWPLELMLCIPLGILLFLQVFLKIIDFGSACFEGFAIF